MTTGMVKVVKICTQIWANKVESGVLVEISGEYAFGSIELTCTDDSLFDTAVMFPPRNISIDDIAAEVKVTADYLRRVGMTRAVTTIGLGCTSIQSADGETAADFTCRGFIEREFGDPFPVKEGK